MQYKREQTAAFGTRCTKKNASRRADTPLTHKPRVRDEKAPCAQKSLVAQKDMNDMIRLKLQTNAYQRVFLQNTDQAPRLL